MIKKTKYRMGYIDRMYRTTYSQRLHWRMGTQIFLATIDIEVAIDYPDLCGPDLSNALRRLKRIQALQRRGRISL